jgi:hypothetical protein
MRFRNWPSLPLAAFCCHFTLRLLGLGPMSANEAPASFTQDKAAHEAVEALNLNEIRWMRLPGSVRQLQGSNGPELLAASADDYVRSASH